MFLTGILDISLDSLSDIRIKNISLEEEFNDILGFKKSQIKEALTKINN